MGSTRIGGEKVYYFICLEGIQVCSWFQLAVMCVRYTSILAGFAAQVWMFHPHSLVICGYSALSNDWGVEFKPSLVTTIHIVVRCFAC